MKKIVVLLVIVGFAFCGCASGSFLGLASAKYVAEKEKALADQEAALEKAQAALDEKQAATEAEIAKLKAELADYQAIKDQAMAAIDQMNQTQKTILDLQAIAQRAEARISSIPREVIKQIVDILDAALKK
jgi:hypothetical protein